MCIFMCIFSRRCTSSCSPPPAELPSPTAVTDRSTVTTAKLPKLKARKGANVTDGTATEHQNTALRAMGEDVPKSTTTLPEGPGTTPLTKETTTSAAATRRTRKLIYRQKRVEMQEAACRDYHLRKNLEDSFEARYMEVLHTNELGIMLSRLKELGSIDALQKEIETTARFPQFSQVWKDKLPGSTLSGILNHAMWEAIDQIEADGVHTEGREMDLSVYVITKSDYAPIIPDALRDLPWFRAAVRPKRILVLDSSTAS
ncbi:hypothetical protein Dda_3840 [Drechslerella dactyloides]|uniref:Uncharacterized protein n=1 Tax=Drechslerella dactyloides TaxID=74499 RepID=A0AAD6NLI1_DREDA|nr:hypothetical protein Dda_3840 [Drechslerella dactyloides]